MPPHFFKYSPLLIIPPPFLRNPPLNAMIVYLPKFQLHCIIFISPSFIQHHHYLPIFQPVPKVADNGDGYCIVLQNKAFKKQSTKSSVLFTKLNNIYQSID